MKSSTHKPTERVLNILQLLSEKRDGITLTEIAQSIHAPKSTIYPIIQTMLDRKFIHLDKSTLKYTLGISTLGIGASYLNNEEMIKFIKKEMNYIVNRIGETSQMGILDGGNVLYLLKEDPNKDNDIRLVSYVGKRLPAYCTALGKALIYQYNKEELQLLFPEGLKRFTKNTVTDFDTLEKQLKKVKIDYIASEIEEITKHVCCYAVPLNVNEKPVAAISVSIPTFRITKEKIELTTELLLHVKDKVEEYFSAVNFEVDGGAMGKELR
ncbi:IclR family transcriptional regulator [Oceanobacillus caeni]|uniref:IclR family transcriptional regulator n=1 Tax=Oceanobacillus caeni TaxID=405946 RepID=UPI003634FBDB